MGHAPGGHPGVPRSMSLNAPYLKEQEYIWFMGGDLNGLRYNTFYEMKGVEPAPRGPLWDPWSMSLNAPHHKEQEYTRYMVYGWGSETVSEILSIL